jgi:plastocyanin
MNKLRFALVALALAPLALGACSISPGDEVHVTMTDTSISLDPGSVRSGRVRLAVDSEGTMDHDLALLLGKDLSAVPRTPDGKLDLTGANQPVDELKTFKPGHYIATSPNLLAGKYLVICTLHVDQGMVAKLTVVPRKKKVS